MLVSTRDGADQAGPVEFRSYRIVDGEVSEEEVRVVDSYADDEVTDAEAPQQKAEH